MASGPATGSCCCEAATAAPARATVLEGWGACKVESLKGYVVVGLSRLLCVSLPPRKLLVWQLQVGRVPSMEEKLHHLLLLPFGASLCSRLLSVCRPPFPQFNVEVLCPDGTGVVTGSYPLPCRMENKLHHFAPEAERRMTTQH